jgi:hypothetical protein
VRCPRRPPSPSRRPRSTVRHVTTATERRSPPRPLCFTVPVLNIDGGCGRRTYLGYSETRGACVLDGSRRAVSDGRPAIKDR